MYDKEQIKIAADCRSIAEALGVPKHGNGRYVASWRNGSGGNVEINREEWYDHKDKEGGDAIRLVETIRGEPFIMAIRWLGEHLGLVPTDPPRVPKRATRYDALIDMGYIEARRYEYTDEAGEPIQYVIRMEHPEKKKEFLQCDPAGKFSVKHIEPVLYNLPQISKSKWAVVVEGEKDANTLIMWGVPATTNAGGAEKWDESFSKALYGKDVILVPDNDSAGKHHMDLIGKQIIGKAKSVRCVTLSTLPKGDVTDWVDQEGGSYDAFMSVVKAADFWQEPEDDELALATAKEANKTSFSNYIEREDIIEGGKITKKKTVKEPRTQRVMISDVHQRFLDFPRKVGEYTLFDHNRDTGQIHYIKKPDELFAWMQETSNNHVKWAAGDSMVTKNEFFCNLQAQSKRYESVSMVPDFPKRDDVYYAYPSLPPPSSNHKIFNGLIDHFSPANDGFRTLLKALFCAPIYFRPGILRPMWVIDSEDGAGTGKTTIAECVAKLYDAPPIQAGRKSFQFGMEEVTKRMLSTNGRKARVFLMDNLTRKFASDELASLITMDEVTGKAPYGLGEEQRPNNITVILTSNSADLDHDLTSRAFFVFVKRPTMDPVWKQSLINYIKVHRLQIFADILDLLKMRLKFDVPPLGRFPEFEEEILKPICGTEEEWLKVCDCLKVSKDQANSEAEEGGLIHEVICDKLETLVTSLQDIHKMKIFIPSEKFLTPWLMKEMEYDGDARSNVPHKVRNIIKNGLLKEMSQNPVRFPSNRKDIRKQNGVMWVGECWETGGPVHIISGKRDEPELKLV